MANKGYPKTVFDIIDQTQIQTINTTVVPQPVVVIMTPYTSDKGSEDWELMYGLADFTAKKGGISFSKHGIPQMLVAEVLRNGGAILGKRMVSDDATLANVTIKARVVDVDNVNYVYLYTASAINAGNLKDAAEAGYGDFDAQADNITDFPLFTIAATGRGASNAFIRIIPEYSTSRSTTYLRYRLEVVENQEIVDTVSFTMNPDLVIDGISQSIQFKINANSSQVRCKMFEDGIYAFISKLASHATMNGESINAATLANLDFFNGLDRRGSVAIGGIVAASNPTKVIVPGENEEDEDVEQTIDAWTDNLPSDIVKVYSLSDAIGIPLSNGSFGSAGSAPIANQTEYEKMLLGAFGKNRTSQQYDPIIYDLDAYKPYAIIDCAYSITVKNAIVDLVDYRGDCVFLADLGTTYDDLTGIIDVADSITYSRNVAIYHNYFNIINPYTKKEVTVTMPFLLAKRLITHVSGGVGRPFAGLSNQLDFPEIITGTVNYVPVNVPGEDQKQKIADAGINYLNYYDQTPVMETMYTHAEDYTKLAFLHNIMAVQEIIRIIRSRCPRSRYTFLDGDQLEEYIDDASRVIEQYKANFKSIRIEYMADAAYENNNIFYATIIVQFRNFIQEEYFQVIAIN